ncbi:MAG: DNA polymerase/3'-5' exonuclease PolX [Gammaproteobacteria bacterium]|nr:DNA polymerase/3'-5' exonuclease PolX [Gammaproteobacteria bacterium]
MPVHNSDIADFFATLADLLEIEGANPFRVRAYRNAAATVRSHPRRMADLIDEGMDLAELPDIGDDLAGKIQTIVETGRLPLLDEVAQRTPVELSDLMAIEGLGAKRVRRLYDELGIRSVEDLRRAADSGAIRELPGFGPKTEEAIRKRVEAHAGRERRMKLADAEDVADALVHWLAGCDGVREVVVAGSFRRRRETVGDLDVLVTASKGAPVMQRLADYDEVDEIVSSGKTRSTVRLHAGLSVDVRVVPQVSYGAALVYFTGSKSHNIALRKRGMRKGYKVNEYGVFKGERRVAGQTEASVYAKLGLPLIPPELREDRGEIDAARRGRLPKLVTLEDIRGDLHCHSKATDGRDTISRMAEAAKERGYEYLSINDHSKHVSVAHGLDRKRLLAQVRAIDRLNAKLDGIVVLKSVEVDILEDGSLDLPDDVLKELDFTVCAVHYQLRLTRRKQTERILRAMDNPYFNILAHPTGRLINRRDPCELDLERLLEAAHERGCIFELNAHPDRLDLNDEACRLAKDIGVGIAVATDAHSVDGLDTMRYGIDQARRGWLEKKDVVNTLSLAALQKRLRRR